MIGPPKGFFEPLVDGSIASPFIKPGFRHVKVCAQVAVGSPNVYLTGTFVLSANKSRLIGDMMIGL